MTSPSSATEKEVQPSVIAATLIKKRGTFDIIRAALFSSSNDDKNAAKLAAVVDINKPSIWANLICGIRPLHHPQFDDVDEEAVIVPRPAARPMPLPLKLHSFFHDVRPLPPPSPAGYTSGIVDEGMSSRYASAEDLRALDGGGTGSDNTEEEEEGCGNKGDSAIDVKAEEFIAKFYEQMRLQRVDSVDLS